MPLPQLQVVDEATAAAALTRMIAMLLPMIPSPHVIGTDGTGKTVAETETETVTGTGGIEIGTAETEIETGIVTGIGTVTGTGIETETVIVGEMMTGTAVLAETVIIGITETMTTTETTMKRNEQITSHNLQTIPSWCEGWPST